MLLPLFPILAAAPPVPVFSMGLDGSMKLRSGTLNPTFRPGTRVEREEGYAGFRIDGLQGGISLGDPSALRLTRSLTLASWIRLESYAGQGTEAQIVFRGDDRGSLDPYSLRTLADGKVAFTIEDARGRADRVVVPVDLHRWTHVMGTLDDRTGQMSLWIDGRWADGHRTAIRPLGRLDPRARPGVGIGNVQRADSAFNQPFDGTLLGLAIYDRAVTPREILPALQIWKPRGFGQSEGSFPNAIRKL